MGHLGRQQSSNTRSTGASQAEAVLQQPVVYSSLDDIAARVEIYKGRYVHQAHMHWSDCG